MGLGAYRFLLSILVVFSHLDVRLFGKNPGITAVVGFYILVGFCMTGLIRNFYVSLKRLHIYIADRVLRIMPQYWLAIALTLTFVAFTQFTEPLFLKNEHGMSFRCIVENVMLIPVNYFMLSPPSFDLTTGCVIVPPAWSLALEDQIYLILPFVLVKPLRTLLFWLSVGFYVAPVMGWLHTDWFGYRLVPGTLWIFLIGTFIYDALYAKDENAKQHAALHYKLVFGLAIGFFALTTLVGTLDRPYTAEVLLGVIGSTLIVHHLGARQPRGAVGATTQNTRLVEQAWSEALGNLAYGIFLYHFLVIWIMRHFEYRTDGVYMLTVLLGSIALSAAGYYAVEHPIKKIRRRYLRKDPIRG